MKNMEGGDVSDLLMDDWLNCFQVSVDKDKDQM